MATFKLPGWLHNLLHNRTEAQSIALRPDRVILTGQLLPAFSALRSILWVGCQDYTPPYYAMLESQGGACSTIDIDPAAAPWGRDGRHLTGSLVDAEALFGPGTFSGVMCNGIFGWGINSPEDRRAALQAMAAVLEPGGLLLMGWNNHKTDNPVPLAAPWFDPHELPGIPAHITVANSTHRYDLLRRR